MAATKFGRLAAHDPRFVLDLRMGRIPRPATEKRTLEWMAKYDAQNPEGARPHSFRRLSSASPNTAFKAVPDLEVKGFRHAA
ncbi:MAG: hypothetical protein ABJ205_13070 [Erythrobacter sp.]|uniref:hypothetical protein n=1 Tax=Erythrobacter sp. TaxID=1042 RepID=UPI003265DFD9